MNNIKSIINNFCDISNIKLNLSFDMPKGFESAFGTYDITVNTIYLNYKLIEEAPEYEILYYLFHELRHAMQYLIPESFDEEIQESIFYVILYNGTCYKLVKNQWQTCNLKGTEEQFSQAYMSLPYEIDANAFAYEKTKEICGDIIELKELYLFWTPEHKIEYQNLQKLFRQIDDMITNS